MPLIHIDRLPVREIFPGLRARLIHSDRVSHSWVEIDSGATFPEHQHPHEQIVSMLEGNLELIVDGVSHQLAPGQVFVIPPGARHSGRALTACRVLDAFAPVREDYR
jgi:quercetin dioxygenase-like cupin family protein